MYLLGLVYKNRIDSVGRCVSIADYLYFSAEPGSHGRHMV